MELISPTGWHSRAYRARPSRRTSAIAGPTGRGKLIPLSPLCWGSNTPSSSPVGSLQVALSSVSSVNPMGIGGMKQKQEAQAFYLTPTCCGMKSEALLARGQNYMKFIPSVYFQWKKFVITRPGANSNTIAMRVTVWP